MELFPIEAGHFKLDGGAMFGVVPKTLWQKTNPADANNRIEMASRCLLVVHENRQILIDCGMGNKQSQKFFSHYDRFGPFDLLSSLKSVGTHPEDITDVFFTHLHFDHCGGAIERNKEGALVPTFKNAHYWVHKKHWLWATAPNTREKASFLPENLNPIKATGQLQFIEDEKAHLKETPFPFEIILVDGHTDKQMLPVFNYKGEKIVYAADLVPTAGHIPIPYVMGYDTRPLKTLKEKAWFMELALENNYLLLLEHDPYNELISLKNTDKGVRLDQNFTFENYF